MATALWVRVAVAKWSRYQAGKLSTCKFKAVPVAIQLCNPARTLVSVGNVNGKVLFEKSRIKH
jgi:hypothetical protein